MAVVKRNVQKVGLACIQVGLGSALLGARHAPGWIVAGGGLDRAPCALSAALLRLFIAPLSRLC